jgi:glycogen operon protein
MSAKRYRLIPGRHAAGRGAPTKEACGPGRPLPLGATTVEGGVNFAVHAGDARAVTLVLFPDGPGGEPLEIELDASSQRTGSVWHVHVPRFGTGLHYAWRTDDRPSLLLDPYARAVAGAERWREGEGERARHRTRYGVVVADRFDWQGDRPLATPLADSVIYDRPRSSSTPGPTSGWSR